ncbi:MAG: biotin--[acetyl-CoA-carboxylase] ligase [Gammaproteobacteria bacterium]|nr:biotin--[acetyl-CoA-carboxylase] ligase [Gammaproteobacteria bacterium]
MNAALAQLIRVLADGNYHSGEQLGVELGVSRAAIWKQLKHLDELQLEVQALPGTGYRLSRCVDLYDAKKLAAAYHKRVGVDASFEIVETTGSTNSDLAGLAERASRTPQFLFAEHQHAGRGRRGRTWVTPYAGTIAFSMLRRFECGAAELGALSLVTGVSLVDALADHGVPRLGLKWPNDLVHRNARGELRKLGGILVEVRSEAEGPCAVVIGAGINYALPEAGFSIEQPWIDLRALLDLSAQNRSQLAGDLAAALAQACDEFEAQGGATYLERWKKYDVLSGERVNVQRGTDSFNAVAQGIDDRGALLVQADGALRAVQSGEVSIRKQP